MGERGSFACAGRARYNAGRRTAVLVQPARRLFTVEEYHRMGEVGLLGPEDRVELIEGEIEVAETSLARDRGVNLPLDARAGIPEVWVVDVEHERVEVHRDPAGSVYRAVEVIPRAGRLRPVALPGVEIAAAGIL